jgi:hypothetical protein
VQGPDLARAFLGFALALATVSGAEVWNFLRKMSHARGTAGQAMQSSSVSSPGEHQGIKIMKVYVSGGQYLSLLDPLVSLAFSVHSGKGTYGLLLGSGISRSASIPTGWEVVIDLIRKLAVAAGEETVSDPAAWYESKFNEAPSYSKLLDRLGSTPQERNNILRSYFESSEEERQQGLKTPTAAHDAIAELVAGGYIRVIITLNFDRLMEMALEAKGIVPTVLSTPDAVEGAVPIQFQKCTVVKLNGDYMDLRMKNTVEELSIYDPRTASLLDRILDEFGFIVCGWSADWDVGLRSAIERARSHRFSVYWAHRGSMSDQAKRLVELRRAIPVEIEDANSFFRSVADKVSALEAYEHPHPLSEQLAAASVKRYISESRHIILLSDLLREETERVYKYISDRFPVAGQSLTHADIQAKVQQLEIAGSILLRMLGVGCRWGGEQHERIWSDCVERLANFPVQGGLTVLLELRRYVGILALYSGGLAALSADNFGALRALFVDARIRDERGEDSPVILKQYAASVLESDVAQKALYGGERRHTPMSDRIHAFLREPLREIASDDKRYDELFDEFEYLLSLKFLEENGRKDQWRDWAPLGRFAWHDSARITFNRILKEATANGAEWAPIKAHLFDSHESFVELCKAYAEKILARANRMW